MNPKISVVIPSYNHEKFIPKAVESVLQQSHKNLELIIIDDGSKDSSWDYISSIKDERVKVFRQQNSGAHNAINRGLELAEGDYLAILNSDDEFLNNRFEIMLRYLEEHPKVQCLSTYIEIINDEGKSLGIKEGWKNCEPWPIACPEKSYKTLDDFTYNLIMGNFVSTTSNILMSKSAFKDVGGMRNFRFSHDWDFMLRMASKHECALLPEPLMRYRIHGTNTINTNRKWLLFEICLVVAANMHRFEGNKLFRSSEPDGISTEFSRLFHSLNFQGNEKFFAVLRSFLNAQRNLGINAPEELLLDNEILRNKLIEEIVDIQQVGNPVPQQNSPRSFREKLRATKRILLEKS